MLLPVENPSYLADTRGWKLVECLRHLVSRKGKWPAIPFIGPESTSLKLDPNHKKNSAIHGGSTFGRLLISQRETFIKHGGKVIWQTWTLF